MIIRNRIVADGYRAVGRICLVIYTDLSIVLHAVAGDCRCTDLMRIRNSIAIIVADSITGDNRITPIPNVDAIRAAIADSAVINRDSGVLHPNHTYN